MCPEQDGYGEVFLIGQVFRIFQKNRRDCRGVGTALGWLLVTAVAFALISVGSLIWIDNSVAVIPDNDPTTFVQLELIDGIEGNEDGSAEWQDDDHDWKDPLHGQMVVRGNGDRDDNKEESYFLRRYVGQVIKPEYKECASSFD